MIAFPDFEPVTPVVGYLPEVAILHRIPKERDFKRQQI